jgi:hypothetical protein
MEPLLGYTVDLLSKSTSRNAKIFGLVQGVNTKERFLAEARSLLERECGRRSLPTVQALLIMYTCHVGQGKDRGGLEYRHRAYQMLDWIQPKLESRFNNPVMIDPSNATRYQDAISRMLWGIYCFERYGNSG